MKIEDCRAAYERIAPYIRRTPLERSEALSSADHDVYLKLENHQLTGSFKLRGAFNKLLTLDAEEKRRGVIAASTGNHGLAVAHAARALQVACSVFVPETGTSSKVSAIRALGVDVRLVGQDCVEAEEAAREEAEATGQCYVSPYNDPAVIAGQGTIAVELMEQLERFDRVYVAVGGGGLIAGIGGHLREHAPHVAVIGCSPSASAPMCQSLEAGEIVQVACEPTLSDGTAGGIEPGAVTFPVCRDVVDAFALVDEDAIRDALRFVISEHHTLIEGAAAVPVAALRSQPSDWRAVRRERLDAEQVRRGRSVLIMCGANINAHTLKEIFAA